MTSSSCSESCEALLFRLDAIFRHIEKKGCMYKIDDHHLRKHKAFQFVSVVHVKIPRRISVERVTIIAKLVF